MMSDRNHFHFTPLAIAANLALRPMPTLPQTAVDPVHGNAVLATMAKSLEAREPDPAVGEDHEKAAEVDESGAQRAGEDGDAPGNDFDLGEVEDRGSVTMAGTTPEQRRRIRDTQELREMIGSRIRAAREFGAVSQTDFATWIGHRKSTQPSLWEKGARLPPVHELPNIANALGCSVDYLMGLSDEPEPDRRTARRVQVVNQVRAAVESMADVLADQLLHESGAVDGLVRSVGLVGKVERLVASVAALQAANADLFDELRCGATLVRAASEAKEAAAEVGAAMDAADRAAEVAHTRLREAVRKAAV